MGWERGVALVTSVASYERMTMNIDSGPACGIWSPGVAFQGFGSNAGAGVAFLEVLGANAKPCGRWCQWKSKLPSSQPQQSCLLLMLLQLIIKTGRIICGTIDIYVLTTHHSHP